MKYFLKKALTSFIESLSRFAGEGVGGFGRGSWCLVVLLILMATPFRMQGWQACVHYRNCAT